MKSRSAWSTLPGAVAGAAPTLMGWSASTGELAPLAFCLFGIVFFWQFPHTWAIAAAYRDDFERVGYRSLPRRYVGLGTLVASLALIATSLLPVGLGVAGPLYSLGALTLGGIFFVAVLRFGDGSLRSRATALLVMSLFYLPLILALAAFDSRIS
jgi:protoheme IX farnesyltransferase